MVSGQCLDKKPVFLHISRFANFQAIYRVRPMKIHKGDTVKVMQGKDAGVTGKAIAVHHDAGKVTVEGANRVYKHVRPSQKNPQGGRLQKEMPIQASNLMVVCPKTGVPTRVGFRFLPDGSKERFAKKSGVSLGSIAPAKERYATKK
jgi:large subunit ribosomal protein L24